MLGKDLKDELVGVRGVPRSRKNGQCRQSDNQTSLGKPKNHADSLNNCNAKIKNIKDSNLLICNGVLFVCMVVYFLHCKCHDSIRLPDTRMVVICLLVPLVHSRREI